MHPRPTFDLWSMLPLAACKVCLLRKRALLWVVALIGITTASAQPVNDTFARQQLITIPTGSDAIAVQGTTIGATTDITQTVHSDNVLRTRTINNAVWYRWQANGIVTVNINVLGNFDTVLAVYTSNVSNPTNVSQLTNEVSYDDDGGVGLQSQLTITNTPANQVYYIAVGSFANIVGDFALTLQEVVGNLPDNIANALPISGSPVRIKGLNSSATTETGEPVHGGAQGVGKSVWLQWTAPRRSTAKADVRSSTFDTVLGVYTAPGVTPPAQPTVQQLVPVSVNRDTFVAADNTTYYIAVAGKNGTSGTVTLDFTATPRNPDFVVPVTSTIYAQTGTNATFSATVAGTGTVLYQWQRRIGSGEWTNLAESSTYGGVATTTLTVRTVTPGMSGDSFRLVAFDTNGVTTGRASTLTVTEFAPARTISTQPLTFSLSSGSPLPPDTIYVVSRLPKGLTLNPATGVISGTSTAKPGTYAVQYGTRTGRTDGPKQTVLIVIDPFPTDFVGSYEAIIEEPLAPFLPVAKVELKVTAKGDFSGRITSSARKSESLRGSFSVSSAAPTAVATVQLRSLGTLSLTLNANGTVAASLGANTGNGTKLTGSTAAPGTYTLALTNRVNLDSAQPARPAPQGASYGLVTLKSNGTLLLKGRLADGTAYTTSLASASDRYRLFLNPNSASGAYLAGTFDLAARTTPQNTTIYGVLNAQDLYWNLPAGVRKSGYPAGFGPLGLTLNMEPWSTPSATNSIDTVLNITPSPDTYTLVLSQGSVVAVNTPVLVSPNNTFAGLPAAAKLKFFPGSGLIRGTYQVSASPNRSASFEGVFLSRETTESTRAIAFGQILVPDVTTKLPASGSFTITPTPSN